MTFYIGFMKQFLKIVIDAIDGKTESIRVAHKDRLCRFAFDLVETLVNRSGCEIIVANECNLAPQKELVEDMLANIWL